MSIYHWKLGDIALAKVCQKVYAKVQVVKNEDGLFYDEKAVLGISSNEDGSINVTHQLCYHVETIRTNQRLWLPYTSLHLAERSRPFYGTDKASVTKNKSPKIAPNSSDWDPSEKDDDDLDTRSNSSSEVGVPNGFVQLGKDIFFDDVYSLLEREAKQRKERDENVERDSKESTEINAMVRTEKDLAKNMEFYSDEYDGKNIDMDKDNNMEIYGEESRKRSVDDNQNSYSEKNGARDEERNVEDTASEANEERYTVENKERVYYYGGIARTWYDEETDTKEIMERNGEETEERQVEINEERGVDNINGRGVKEQKKSNAIDTNQREIKENEKRYKGEYNESVAEKNEIRELEEIDDSDAEENKERYSEAANEKDTQEKKKRNADKYKKTEIEETKKRYADENKDRDPLGNKEGCIQENKEINVEENMTIFVVENNERNAEEKNETNEEDNKETDTEEYNDSMEQDGEKNRKRDRKEHEVRPTQVIRKRDAEFNRYGELEDNVYKELDTKENTERNAEEIDTPKFKLIEAEKKERFSEENLQCHAEKKCIIEENKKSISEEADKIKEISAERHKEILDYLNRHDVSLEDKFQTALKIGKVTEKDLENYLDNCWKYLVMMEDERRLAEEDEERKLEEMGSEYEGGSEPDYNSDDLEEDENYSDMNTEDNCEDFLLDPPKPSVHAWWCLVCGKDGGLAECPRCPSSYHPACKEKWLVAVFHRMKQTETQVVPEPETCVQGNSSNDNDEEVMDAKEDIENDHCPSCTWGPKISYNDIVWNKYGSCPWWPARVLPKNEIPDWLMERAHYRGQIPLRYYGTQEHAWATLGRTCLFLPWHVDGQADRVADEPGRQADEPGRQADEPGLAQACLDACDHYVTLYLT